MNLGLKESPIILWKELGKFVFSVGINAELYGLELSCLWNRLPISYSDIGYKREGRKLKRLTTIYLSSSEIEKFNRKRVEVVRKKKNFVLLFRFGGQEKKSKVGDFCLVASTFIFVKGTLKSVHVFYRTTECVTKFLADLVFLDDLFKNILFLNVDGIEVKFLFTKVYVKYLHYLNYVMICKKFFGEDLTDVSEEGKALVEKVSKGKEFKYKAASRMVERFLKGEATF